MSTRATVLYDTPGPKGRRLNLILSVVSIVIIVALLALVLTKLGANGHLAADMWTPFLESTTWTTYLLPGLFGTISAAVVSILLALVLGTVLGLGRLSEVTWVRWICGIIVEFFRAVPVLLLMLFAYALFGLYNLVPASMLSFTAVVFGLTLYNGSVIAEILRSGILSLPKGQTEAAMALGLSRTQMMVKVLLPQAVAAMLPALIAQMVIALKDSALGYIIGYVEFVRSGIQVASFYRNYLPALFVVAVIMILINYLLSRAATRIEQQLRAGRHRKNIVANVPHQPDQGLLTKDQENVDKLDPNYHQIKNPGQ